MCAGICYQHANELKTMLEKLGFTWNCKHIHSILPYTIACVSFLLTLGWHFEIFFSYFFQKIGFFFNSPRICSGWAIVITLSVVRPSVRPLSWEGSCGLIHVYHQDLWGKIDLWVAPQKSIFSNNFLKVGEEVRGYLKLVCFHKLWIFCPFC